MLIVTSSRNQGHQHKRVLSCNLNTKGVLKLYLIIINTIYSFKVKYYLRLCQSCISLFYLFYIIHIMFLNIIYSSMDEYKPKTLNKGARAPASPNQNE